MRKLLILCLVMMGGMSVLFSCNKWKDAPPKDDPRLTNPYCNDPAAVNFNRGFPGKPDNTVCFYPTDIFKGVYMYHDSIYRDTLFIKADSFLITIDKVDNRKISVAGFCLSGSKLTFTADPTYTATSDTTLGDSSTLNRGQQFCRLQDTVSGTIIRDRVDTTMLRISLTVISDSGSTTHGGTARLTK